MKTICIIFVSLALVLLASCDRAIKSGPSQLKINISGFENRTLKKVNVEPLKLNPNGTINPTSISEINCLGVMVSGPEEFLRRNSCEIPATSQTIKVGYFVGGRYIGANSILDFVLDVPSGKDRVLHLIGFKTDITGAAAGVTDQAVCEGFYKQESLEAYLSDPYLLAEAGQLEMPAGGTKEVSMTAAFSTSSKIGECYGPDFGDGGGGTQGGPPAQFRIAVQDLPSATLPIIKNNSCVGVRFELVDSAGLPATNLVAKSAVIKSFLPTTGYYYPMSSTNMGCNGTPLTAISGDVSVSFAAGNNTLQYSFRPDVAMTNLEFRIEDPTATLPTVSRSFSFDGTTGTANQYQVYDLYNNRSTKSTTAGTPMFAKRLECRPAAIVLSTPSGQRVTTGFGSGAARGVKIRASGTVGDVVFYPTQTDCINNSGASTDFSIGFSAAGFTYDHYVFSYKVNAPTGTNFSIEVSNDTTLGGILLASADLLTGTNFWRSND